MRIKLYGSTNIGRTRKNNQDSIYFDNAQKYGVVADGIGGRKGGEIASSIAVQGMRKEFTESEVIRHDQIDSFLINAVDKVNDSIIEYSTANPTFQGMGTTINCIFFVGSQAKIAHVGDSRTYLYYQDHMFLLTIDHNVKTFINRKLLPPEQNLTTKKGEALVKALGLMEELESDIYSCDLKPGQIFLSCSDGLYNMVSDKRISQMLKKYKDKPNELPKRLIDEANKNGGRDNITVLVSALS